VTSLAAPFALLASLAASLACSTPAPPRIPASWLRAAPARHRLHRPAPPLPRSLTVDEQEWSVIPSQTVVAAGVVTFHVYDRGMDPHDLTVRGPGGIAGVVWMQPGGSGTIVARLRPGTYVLYCSMFMGTPQSHFALGMHARLTVR
jgi:hypothetical protein